MSFLYDQIYEDVKKLIKKYDSRDPREILIQRGVNIIAFKENTKLLGMYKIIKSIKYNFYIYKTYRIPSSIKLFLFDGIVIIVIFLVLIYLTIYKSYGWLIYPCIITISSMFIVIYFSFKSNSNNKYIKIKKIKPKKQQKPNKQKDVQKSNFKKYKLINKNRVKDKNNNEYKK